MVWVLMFATVGIAFFWLKVRRNRKGKFTEYVPK